MLKEFIEWTEGDISRGRKVVLFGTIFVFLLVTIGLFIGAIYGLKMAVITTTLYTTFVGLMVGVYGFYTSTNANKTLNNKTVEDIFKKIEELKGL